MSSRSTSFHKPSGALNRGQTLAPRHPGGFTLIETLVVMIIVAMIGALVVTSIGTQGPRRLTASALLITTYLHDARSLALAEATPTRLAIDSDPSSKNYMRAVTILKWQREVNVNGGVTGSWIQARPWTALPEGVVFEIGQPAYITDATVPYVADDPAVLTGDYITDPVTCLTGELPGATALGEPALRPYSFFEYKPSGFAAAYLAGAGGRSGQRNIHLVLSLGFYDETGAFFSTQGETITNWAHLVTDSLTGRIKLYRP